MRKSVVLLALALSVSALACSKSPKDRLQGKWLGDSVTNVSPEQSADVTAWVKGTSLEFAGDRMVVTVPAEQPRGGEFKVAKVDGRKLSVAVAREGGSDTTTLTLAEDSTLHWDIGEGREVVLARLK
jgi:hypothetical protein